MKQKLDKQNEDPYITPNELSKRWKVSRSSVDRMARRAGFTCLCLGEGKNGTVRYLREEVIAHEQQRQVKLTA